MLILKVWVSNRQRRLTSLLWWTGCCTLYISYINRKRFWLPELQTLAENHVARGRCLHLPRGITSNRTVHWWIIYGEDQIHRCLFALTQGMKYPEALTSSSSLEKQYKCFIFLVKLTYSSTDAWVELNESWTRYFIIWNDFRVIRQTSRWLSFQKMWTSQDLSYGK